MIILRVPLTGLKQSSNRIYAGVFWAERKRIKDSILDFAKIFFRPVQKIRSYPVEIRYKFFFFSRPLDTLNTAYLAKMFEDSLVSLGIIKDDSPQYVARSILEVITLSKKNKPPVADELWPEAYEKNEDWLEIIIKKIN